MIQRQGRDHDLLPFLDKGLPLLVELLHVCPDLLHVGHEIAVAEHRALGNTCGAAGVLQDRGVVQRQRHRLEAVVAAATQHLLEGNGLRQAVLGHHLLQVLDRGVDQQPLERRQHVTDARLDEHLDAGIGQDLLHQLAERIQVNQPPHPGILELVTHLPCGIERIGIDHDQPGPQGAEDSNRVLQQVRHLHGDTVTRLQIGVIL